MGIFGGGQNDFFGLDIGTTAMRVVQLKNVSGRKELSHYGQVGLAANVAAAATPADKQALTQAIAQLVKTAGISTKNVAANLPSSKVFTTVIDLDKLAPEDLAKTINYQADSFIPTPLAQSKIDWKITGDSPGNAKKVEVLLSSIENKVSEERLQIIEAAGLNVLALEPDSLALTRALVADADNGALMVLDMDDLSTDLVITVAGIPRLVRTIQLGAATVVRAAAQNMGVADAQAQEYVFKFGLNKDGLEGKLYNAIIGTVDVLVGEIQKSIKFFQSRYGGVPLQKIIVTGGASTLPLFPLYVANKMALNVEIGNSWRNITYPPARQDELLAVSNHFAVAVGLAERTR
ncbi:MAG TPA: type IV pilus assembly protein PilM [Candidatus Saccharimonadales bacterium]|nr:type IV pilus assembly protein PilM [Candidatus Saccharimonadales bacterium]